MMNYDTIDGNYRSEDWYINFFTIGNLIGICRQHPDKVVHFLGTNRSPGELHSWRGSYDLPAISTSWEDKTGEIIAEELTAALKEVHWGWKGGQYHYNQDDEFYIAESGNSSEYKVVKAELEDDILVLYTKLDPY